MSVTAQASFADTSIRIATWHVELNREGPGLLVRDILRNDEQIDAITEVITAVRPDILLLTGIDWDYDGVAIRLLADRLTGFPHLLHEQPNAGVPTGLDLDGDGRLGGPGDAQGYGAFRGQGGMALMSALPLTGVADHSAVLWQAVPEPLLYAGMPDPVRAVQRLFSVGLWEVDVAGLRLVTFYATPPVFDGPEDRNGRRNHDELLFVARRAAASDRPVVVIGNANLDPVDGEGLKPAIQALLDHPRLQDPRPTSAGGAAAANPAHRGDPAADTADWSDPEPGNLRVSYVLPDATLTVLDAGLVWPAPDAPLSESVVAASRHRLVWVDLMVER